MQHIGPTAHSCMNTMQVIKHVKSRCRANLTNLYKKQQLSIENVYTVLLGFLLITPCDPIASTGSE